MCGYMAITPLCELNKSIHVRLPHLQSALEVQVNSGLQGVSLPHLQGRRFKGHSLALRHALEGKTRPETLMRWCEACFRAQYLG